MGKHCVQSGKPAKRLAARVRAYEGVGKGGGSRPGAGGNFHKPGSQNRKKG